MFSLGGLPATPLSTKNCCLANNLIETLLPEASFTLVKEIVAPVLAWPIDVKYKIGFLIGESNTKVFFDCPRPIEC